VVAYDDLEPMEKRPFAFGAEATRRINRDADALTDFGLSGPFVRERDGVGRLGTCEGSAVSGTIRGEGGSRVLLGRVRSDLVCCRDRLRVAAERASGDFGCE
jgi:hypothetical protein